MAAAPFVHLIQASQTARAGLSIPDLNLLALTHGFVLFAMTGLLDDLMAKLGGPASTDRQHEMEDLLRREEELQRQLERLRALLQASSTLTATLNYERVLELALDLGASAAGGQDKLVSALLLFSGENDHLYVASGRGLTQADFRVELPGRRGVIEEALTACEIRVAETPVTDPELQVLAGMQRCSQAVCIPLAVGLELYGMMVFAHPAAGFFNQERLDLLEAVAQQAIAALQNARLYRDLQQEKERMMEIQEEARKKLARDLHDGPTQSIGAIAMRVNFARRLMERDPRAAAEELFKIEELSRRTTKEIRQMLFTLRPLVLESDGLAAALHHLAEKTQDTHGQKVLVEAEGDAAEDMELGKQGVVFYIAEEAVNNARKHANADNIWVRLIRKGDFVMLEIEDDGAGFDVESVEEEARKRGSLGMINLRERAELVSGVFKIDSFPGRGTRVRVIVPLSLDAAERLHRPGAAA